MSCAAPISPAFKAAIQKNICPACGEQMMNENTQELLEEIKNALEEMPSDPEGIAGWLLSHYELRKIGTGEPVQQFYGGPSTAQLQKIQQMQGVGGMPVSPEQIQQMQLQQMGGVNREDQLRNQPMIAPNKLQQFYQQSGLKRPKTKADYAAIAAQIQAGGADYGESTDVDASPNAAMQMAAAQQQMQQLQQLQQLQQMQQMQQMQMQQGQGMPQQPIMGDQALPVSPGMQKQMLQQQMLRQRQKMPQMDLGYPEEYVEEALDPSYTQKALAAMGAGGKQAGSSLSAEERAAIQGLVNGPPQNDLQHSDNLPPSLQIGRMDRLEKQQSLQSMGSVGKITRRG